MNKKPNALLRSFAIGLKDGLLILIILAVITPFVYQELLERTTSSSEVMIGSIDGNGDLPTRPPTPTPGPMTPTTTPTPVPMPTATPSASGQSKPIIDGGFIRLTIDPLRAGIWTQVQWLAGDGNWYDVNGWGGHLTSNNDVLWYVGKEHLGAQPAFRWQIYDAEGGSLLATSSEFYLPQTARETIQVTATLPADQ
jgi:hypothetical protein